MKFPIALLLSGLFLCGTDIPANAATKPVIAGKTIVPSSESLEKQLQALNWPQFESVVRSVPKLRARVDAYGPAGWRYVRSRYQTYGWRKSIEKLEPHEKKALNELIARVRKGK